MDRRITRQALDAANGKGRAFPVGQNPPEMPAPFGQVFPLHFTDADLNLLRIFQKVNKLRGIRIAVVVWI